MRNSNCSKSVFDNLGLKQRSHYYRNGLVNMSAYYYGTLSQE